MQVREIVSNVEEITRVEEHGSRCLNVWISCAPSNVAQFCTCILNADKGSIGRSSHGIGVLTQIFVSILLEKRVGSPKLMQGINSLGPQSALM